MTSLRKTMATLAGSALLFGALAGCSSERTESDSSGSGSDKPLIGIAMPTKSLERWNNDGAHLEELLTTAGYETTLQYANNKVDEQITQLQNMINQGADVLVIASIDGTALGPVLESAAAKDIPVIAYDRLINDSPNVDYYATFDNEKVGTLQGEFIVEQLDLDNATAPVNLEPFAGSPDDNNARFFFKGAWDVLLPYVESGAIVVPSGKAPATLDGWTTIGIQGWESAKAQSEMETRLNSFYTDKKVDVVLSPNDSLALGIEQALTSGGYTSADWPLVTGQDADEANVKNMIAGMQAMTVWKDTRALGDQVATMITQILDDEAVTVNDETTYDNGVKVVPAFLLDPLVVTPDTIESSLVDSGFYTAAQLGL